MSQEQGPQNGADEAWSCPQCVEPYDREYCHHEAAWEPLARALAVHFQEDEKNWAWFLDDAGDLIDEAGSGPYRIVGLDNGYFSEHAFALNNLIVTIGEGGKDTRATPEVAAKLPESVQLVIITDHPAAVSS